MSGVSQFTGPEINLNFVQSMIFDLSLLFIWSNFILLGLWLRFHTIKYIWAEVWSNKSIKTPLLRWITPGSSCGRGGGLSSDVGIRSDVSSSAAAVDARLWQESWLCSWTRSFLYWSPTSRKTWWILRFTLENRITVNVSYHWIYIFIVHFYIFD